MKNVKLLKVGVFLLFPVFLFATSCSTSENQTKKVDPPIVNEVDLSKVSDVAARKAMIDAIAKNASQGYDQADKQIIQNKGVKLTLDILSLSSRNNTGTTPPTSTPPTSTPPTSTQPGESVPVEAIPTDTRTMEEIIREQLDKVFSSAVRVGNKITYKLDESWFCIVPAELVTCKSALSHITVVQTLESETAGLVAFKWDEFVPVTLSYKPEDLHIDLDLAEIKKTSIEYDKIPGVVKQPELPETFTGIVRISLSATSTRAKLALAIRQAIDVASTSVKNFWSIQIQETVNLFSLESDTSTGISTMNFGLKKLDISFPYDGSVCAEQGNCVPITRKIDLHAGGLTGTLQFDEKVHTVTGTGMGIGGIGEKITVKADNNEIFSLTLPDFGFVVNGASKEITFNTEFSFKTVYTLLAGVVKEPGELSVKIPMDSLLKDVSTDPQTLILQVLKGSFDALGTEHYIGELLIKPGSTNHCFTIDRSKNFPYLPIACPGSLRAL